MIGTRVFHTAADANLAARTIFATGTSAVILGIYLACDGVADEVVHTDGAGVTLTTQTAGVDVTAPMEVPFITDGFIVGVGLSTSFVTVIYRLGA